jgi:hypothetical protein
MITVNVAKNFTRFPAGRLKKHGETSGEAFREKFLESGLSKNEDVMVELDGTIGYSSSFLEEAFGGLIRTSNISPDTVKKHLKLVSDNTVLIDEIKEYIDDAINQRK